mgnify:CR=1 FL=1
MFICLVKLNVCGANFRNQAKDSTTISAAHMKDLETSSEQLMLIAATRSGKEVATMKFMATTSKLLVRIRFYLSRFTIVISCLFYMYSK